MTWRDLCGDLLRAAALGGAPCEVVIVHLLSKGVEGRGLAGEGGSRVLPLQVEDALEGGRRRLRGRRRALQRIAGGSVRGGKGEVEHCELGGWGWLVWRED